MPDAPRTFAHLHQHTAYSLLDGAARIQDLLSWVKQVTPESPALAMTDHGNMHGAVEFYRAAVNEGVKPILGFEAYVTAGSRFERRRPNSKLDGGYFHLTLLAKNLTGYRNLCKLNSRAWLEGFYMKPRVDHELLREHAEGVIALSGCLGAQIPRTILDADERAGEETLRAYLDIYGDDFWVELQDHGLDQQRRLNPVLKEFADRYGLGLVATNDGHYVRKEDAKAHEALLAIQTKTTLSDEDRFRFPCDEFYVKSPEEMAQALPEQSYPGALANTARIAEQCNVDLPIGERRVYQMPELPIPEGRTMAEQLRVQTYTGLRTRYPEQIDDALWTAYLEAAGEPTGGDEEARLLRVARAGERGRRPKAEGETYDRYEYPHLDALRESGFADDAVEVLARAEYELGVIIAMGFPDYFVMVADFINWAKDQKIAVGPGRGSGAGSIVAYAMRITDIDPLEFGLLFERFLNPERVSMPDFDIDFSDVRRNEVIDYVRGKYGEDRVAHIATFGTMASKAAIKDAARVMEASFSEADRVSKLVPIVFGRSVPIDRALAEVPELKELYESTSAREYVDVARTLEGLTRHASVHAAGVIIARDPVQELAPVFRSGDGPVVCQYDMGSVEDLGFIKMDFLGLRTLSFIEAAVRIVQDTRGVALEPGTFPHDDPATFELLSGGRAAGVFQFESGGMVDTLRKLKPRRIQDLIAVSALYRPGPMENIPTYIRRHHGEERVSFDDFPASEAILAPILEETYGIPVYQEQIMQMAQAVAGYSLGEADLLRRAMSKKKVEEMERHRAAFERGAGEKGIDAAEANRIFDMLEKFANYGFNKCVVGSTRIVLTNGDVVTARELHEQRRDGATVVAVDERLALKHSPVADVMSNGVKPVYRVTTSLGKEITATGNHPFRTLTGWRNLEDLSAGDRIAAPGSLPVQGTEQWPKHESALLGWILSEGNTRHPSGVYVYSSDPECVEDILEAAGHFPHTVPAVVQRPERADGYTIYLGTGQRGSASRGRSGVRLWLEGLDQVGSGAADKAFPNEAFRLCNTSLAVLLGRYWSGDGFVAGEGNLTPYAATSSRRLAQHLQHLLLRFGVVARITEKRFAYRGGRVGYTVHVLGRRSIEAFLEWIAPHLVGKDEQVSCLRTRLAEVPPERETIDTLPPEVKQWVDRARRRRGLTWRELERQSSVSVKEFYGGPKVAKKGFRRATIRRLAECLDCDDLRDAASEDVFWERVVSVEPAGTEQTFDLEVEDTHNFVANDLFVHNSHSAAYGEISYQTAYLKAHYPVEFAAALLTVERADSDKVAEYVADARQQGIDVLPPDINESGGDFTPVGDVVRFGLYAVKNIGENAVRHIVRERETNGRYRDLFDFTSRVDGGLVNKRALQHLVKAGAFDALGDRGTLLANVEAALKFGAARRESQAAGQMALFGADELRPPALEPAEALGELDLLRFEKEALGLYLSAHPMRSYPGLEDAASCAVAQLDAWYARHRGDANGSGRLRVVLSGILQNVVKKPTRKGTMMGRFELADTTGAREVVAFSRTFEQIQDRLAEDVPAVVVAEVSEDGEGLRLVADRLYRWDLSEQLPEVAVLDFDLSEVGNHQLLELRSLLDEHAGSTPVMLRFDSTEGRVTYAADGVSVDPGKLELVEATCPWVRSTVTVDRRRLLSERRQPHGNGNGNGASAAAEVPF